MGLAYLPDGRRLSYELYLQSPEWRRKKEDRLAFDNWQCGICHATLNQWYETHHLNYARLGDENIETDIISTCKSCHTSFHHCWQQIQKFEDSPYNHWKDYSLEDTVKICIDNLHEDIFFGGTVNCCNIDTINMLIDRYYAEHEVETPTRICEEDVRMFFRNKRYDLFFEASEDPNFELEAWLDSKFGKKGGVGGNPIRSTARSFYTKHKPASMKRIYKENSNTNILMKECKDYEKA